MAIQQDVNINVNANTSNAQEDVSKLENNIKTLDGAINLVGGSIEVLAGGLALTGAVTEEQAEKFQTAAVGAIALADGSKRALEGFKTLATETKVLTGIQKIYNAVLNANPIFIIAGVLATATIALVAWTAATNRQKTSAELAAEATEKQKNALADLNAEQEFAVRLARARGASQEELLQQAVDQAKQTKQAATDARVEQQAINRFSEELQNARAAEEKATQDLQVAEENLATFRKRQAEAEAKRKRDEFLANTTFSEETVNLKAKEVNQIIDLDQKLLENSLRTADIQRSKVLEQTRLEEIERKKRIALAEAEEQAKQALLTDGIDNIQGALSALFGENKAIASANVLIDAAQAGVAIIKNSQSTGPFAIAYQATQFALLAATTIASLRQINAAEPGSAGGGGGNFPKAPSTGGGILGGGIPNTGGLGQTGGRGSGRIGGIPTVGTANEPIRAYVLVNDVNNAQEANRVIQRRRSLTG